MLDKLDYIKNGDCLDYLKVMPENTIDLTVTSPPYDDLRKYKGYTWDFKNIVNELFRVTKLGGVVVWIVSDATVNGSETGTSFKQALYFMETGFNLHDTMIWRKDTLNFPDKTRYGNCFEYMFVFSKGKPKTVNKICDRPNKWAGTKLHGTSRGVDGETFRKANHNKGTVKPYGARFNVWDQPTEKKNKTGHPAVYPKQLVMDHIISWSNEGDVVLDPFIGSGTTALAAIELNRHYIGYEISKEYCDIAVNRVKNKLNELDLS